MDEHTHVDVEDFLGEIFARVSAHFALEERTMLTIDYPEYWDHKGDHERLLDDLRDIMERYESKHTLDADDLSRRLDDWFTIHFRTFDARFHHFVH
jgi:hemerythrin-like metal-binding protein